MTSIRAIGMLLLCSIITVPSRADPTKKNAETIVAASKAATGGAAWDKPQGCTERGTHGDGAITYLTRFSLRDYGMRTDGERDGNIRSTGFDGKASWRTAGPGQVDIKSDPASLQEAITSNYLSINGFFFPERFPAVLKYIRSEKENAETFDVIEITPQGPVGPKLRFWSSWRTRRERAGCC
jgi:hypothetical protein